MFELNKDEFVGKSIKGKIISDVSFIESLKLINVIFESGEYERYTLQNYFNSEIPFDGVEPVVAEDKETKDIKDEVIENDSETHNVESSDTAETPDVDLGDEDVTEDIE